MPQRIRAHFDGRVIVPDEPIDLPRGQRLYIDITPVPSDTPPDPKEIERRLEALRAATGIVSGPTVPDEALRRENLYE